MLGGQQPRKNNPRVMANAAIWNDRIIGLHSGLRCIRIQTFTFTILEDMSWNTRESSGWICLSGIWNVSRGNRQFLGQNAFK
jgi:hypothetical protein